MVHVLRISGFVISLWLGFSLFSCNTIKPYYGKDYRDWQSYRLPDSSQLLHTIYLIGDGGDMTRDDKILGVLRRQLLDEPDSTSSIIFLGDNIYLHGLPGEDDPDRQEKEEIILAQMEVARDYKGNVIFVPGNHDWDYSGPDGLQYINNQEKFVEEYFDNANTFLPDNGCPGPVLVPVTDNLVMIILDTEWWIHPYEVPQAPENGCITADKTDFIIRLEAMIRANAGKHVMIAAHHPVISNGNHGGHYNIIDHIFPLRLVRDNLYIPLPLIGSIYPVSRKLGVSPQDIPNTEFQQYKNALLAIIEDMPNVIYATGHDHNLQLNEQGDMHHIISGSSSKTQFAARGFGADYVQQQKGFARVKYYRDGEVWVEYFVVNEDNPDGLLTFRKPLYALEEIQSSEKVPENILQDSIYQAPATAWKERKFPGSTLIGNGRFEEWTMPVTVPVLDPGSFDGGFSDLQKSGARNSLSLSARSGNGGTWLIQPVEKFAGRGLSGRFRETWLASGIREQNRANHPYGSLVIGDLSRSLSLTATWPRLYYVPVSPVFGQYMDEFGGTLSIVERTLPEIDPEKESPFSAILTTRSMIRRIEEDPSSTPDARQYLKERILDLLSGNFERRRTDWEWLVQKNDTASVLRPFSLERAEMFPEYDGLIAWLRSRTWNSSQIISYDDSIRDIRPFVKSSAGLDQRVLSGLTWEDWASVYTEMDSVMNGAVISNAVHRMPGEFNHETLAVLEGQIFRRWAGMKGYLEEYYKLLSGTLSIHGTNLHDEFRIISQGDNHFHVQVTAGERIVFDRVMVYPETKEIRLYGLEGDDEFIMENVIRELTIRIMPGPGTDSVSAAGMEMAIFRNIHLYEKDEYTPEQDVRIRRHGNFQPDTFWEDIGMDYSGGISPLALLEYNKDDDFLIGAGVRFDKTGFRRAPWLFSGSMMAEYATATNAFQLQFDGTFYSLLGDRNDLTLSAYYADPYVFNYFGEGNETENTASIGYYRVPLKKSMGGISLQRRFSEAFTMRLLSGFSSYEVKEADGDDSILDNLPGEEFFQTGYKGFAYIGGELDLSVFDVPYNPEKGFRFTGGLSWNRELSNGFGNYVNTFARLSIFITPNLPFRLTFATRAGIEHNEGEYYFYQSSFLGGLTTLRGYRRTRFAGESALFVNNEIRLKLIPVRNDMIRGVVGVYGFFDFGKVRDREGNHGSLHTGYGPGVYFQAMDRLIWRISYGISDEDNYVVFGAGFFF